MRRYLPLFTLFFTSFLAASAISLHFQVWGRLFMHHFMGLAFLQFSLLKLFDPVAFANGFQKYDLLAKRSRLYALSYPFIELFLALAYLSCLFPVYVYGFTVVLMALSAFGVIKSLREGLDLRCACMGSALDVPLSTVTLAEDLFMGLMALYLLLF